MEGIGLGIIVFALIVWNFYTGFRDVRRWNNGTCKETGKLWEFTGGVSFLGYYCYYGGLVGDEQQFIWLADLHKRPHQCS